MTWREEIDWRYLRLLVWSHLALWLYGAVLAGLHLAGLLEGVLRDALALGAFAGLAACLVLIFKIVRKGKNAPDLVMIAFFVSICAFVLLLSVLGLNGVIFEF
jgi:hypothetical protein